MIRCFVQLALLVPAVHLQNNRLREEVLSEDDLSLIRQESAAGSAVPLISGSSPGCILIPSSTGCTRYKRKTCRSAARAPLDTYDPDCSLYKSYMLRNCQVKKEYLPSQSSVSICGTRVERNCQGPCYNCKNVCRSQYERTCWKNHAVKSLQALERENGVDYFAESERLESLYSCSQKKVGDICAPINCRLEEKEEDCVTKNETDFVTLTSRKCELCVQHLIAETVSDEVNCKEDILEDCRVELKESWRKQCSRDETSATFVFTDDVVEDNSIEENRSGLQDDLGAIYASSVNPVNSLIIETLKKIRVSDVKDDTVVVISSPRPTTENAESTKENEQFLEDILESLEEDSREEVQAIKELKKDIREPVNINVNVKYDFESGFNPSAIKAQLEENPQRSPSQSEAENKPAAERVDQSESSVGTEEKTSVTSEDSFNKRPAFDPTAFADFQAEAFDFGTRKSVDDIKESEAINQSVYFDPQLQILNTRERNKLSEPASTTTLAPPKQITFQSATPLPPLLTVTTTTKTTSIAPETSTTTASEAASLSSSDLLKMCFLTNVGCDFSHNEIRESSEATTTTTTTTSTTTSTTTAASKRSYSRKELSAREKVRLCFLQQICTDEDIAVYQGRQRGGKEVKEVSSGEEPRRGTTTTIATTTAGESPASRQQRLETDRFRRIKARAKACIFRGIC